MSNLAVVLGSLEQRGAWRVPADLTVSVMLGSAALDLRQATLAPGVTTIHAGVRLGNLQVIVPPGLPVEVEVSPVLSSVEANVCPPPSASPLESRLLDPYRDTAVHEPSRIRIVGTLALASLDVREAT